MRTKIKRYLWAPLFLLLAGFLPVAAKAGTLTQAQSRDNIKSSVLLVDDHGRRDRDRDDRGHGRWDRGRDWRGGGRWDRGDRGWRRDWDDSRWRHHRRDRDDYYGKRYYYYPNYGNYYGYPNYNYNYGYSPYGYAYPYGDPYRGNGGFLGGLFRLW